VEVTDAAGLRVPTANDNISFELSGSGRIIGVDNGQPDSHESYQGRERRAFNGLALALIQSAARAGSISLSASAPSLAAARIDMSAL
jgi:beta-galactosidase